VEEVDSMTVQQAPWASYRGWKWLVGVVYIVLAIVLFVLGRVDLWTAALIFGIGVILV
jgi:hypothetical protein